MPTTTRTTTRCAAALIALSLALAGCGSDDPAPVASSGASVPAVSSAVASEPAPAASSEAPITDRSKSSEPADSVPASSSDDSSSAGSSSSGEDSSFSTLSSSAPTSEDGTTADPGTSSGGIATDLDDVSVSWFESLCTGLAPLGGDRLRYDPAGGSVEVQQDAAEEYYDNASDVGEELADDLAKLPAPTMEGGDGLATATIAAFRVLSDEADRQSDLIDDATDAASLEKALDVANSAVGDSLDAFGPAVQKVTAQPGIRAALAKIPACAPLFGS